MLQSALHPHTATHGAQFGPTDGWQMPLNYGDISAEYQAAHSGAVLRDASHWARLRFSGADSLDFLHRMSTNHFAGLEDGTGFVAVLPDSRGRIVAAGPFYRCDDAVWGVLSPPDRETIPAWFDRYIFTERITIDDLTPQTAMVELSGPQAAELALTTLGLDLTSVQPHCLFDSNNGDLTTVRFDWAGRPGLRAFGAAAGVAKLWDRLAAAGACPIGEAAWETCRIENGVPGHDNELTLDHNPWEAGLDSAIHMDKGCYIGQEVIARLDTYLKVKQRLTGLLLAEGPLPAPATKLKADNRSAGQITSSTHSPRLGRGIALAYIRRVYLEPGTKLEYQTDKGPVAAEVAKVPFVP